MGWKTEAELGNGKIGKVLLMDDEEMVRAVVGEMLKISGNEVEYAKDGEEAIEKYLKARDSEAPFAAVIVDLNIPNGMGGKETVERLRRIDSNLKAVVSSGYPDDPVMMNYREYGFKAVIPKPFRVSDLNSAMQALACV